MKYQYQLLHTSGHIQIAQVPDRGEPDRQGEINFPYVFDLLRKLNYDGFVGLEYKPRGECIINVNYFSCIYIHIKLQSG